MSYDLRCISVFLCLASEDTRGRDEGRREKLTTVERNLAELSSGPKISLSQNSLRCSLLEVNGGHLQMEFIGGERLFSTVHFQDWKKG